MKRLTDDEFDEKLPEAKVISERRFDGIRTMTELTQ